MPVAMVLEFKEISHFGPMNVTRVESGFLETIVGIDKSVADMPGTWRTSRSTKVFPEAVDRVSVPDWVVWTCTICNQNVLDARFDFGEIVGGSRHVG